MQIFLTVVSGTLVLVIGQIALKAVIEPWQHLREAIARVAYVLDLYQAQYGNPGVGTREAQDEAATELRRCMAELSASAFRIPFYDFFARAVKLPSKEDLHEVQKHLWELSNSVHRGSTDRLTGKLEIIQERLGIELWGDR